MTNLLNDPRLTAYALGELPAAEAAAFETLLAGDSEALAFVAETRALAGALENNFSTEALPRLSVKEREKILPGKPKMSRWFTPSLTQVAALVVLGVGVSYLALQTQSRRAMKGVVPLEQNAVPLAQNPVPKAVVRAAPKENKQAAAPEAQESESLMSDAPAESAPAQTAFLTQGKQEKKNVRGFGGKGYRGGSVALGTRMSFSEDDPGGSALELEEGENFNTEAYAHLNENGFKRVKEDPLSTFSADVDTASYANVRRFLELGQMPPKDAVRIEEMVNYFPYDYEAPKGTTPFSVQAEMASAPWNDSHRLLRVAMKAKEISFDKAPRSNLVFLLDVSSSMTDENKLPLVKKAMGLLVENLKEKDRLAIVVYAGSSGLALPSTAGNEKEKILAAIEKLEAGGSTNGGEGIELAYKIAGENFISGGVNRVVLATDGDFNVGISDEGSLVRLIQEKAKSNIFLTVLGFGTGNVKDSQMEKLANKGNGNYAYIDSLLEAKKALVEEAGGTLVTVAKDVKLQLEFNPAYIEAYRLIGYENRLLNKEDFNDDKKDAGEIGAGHTVTALYELIPAGGAIPGAPPVDPLKYQSWGVDESSGKKEGKVAGAKNGEALTVKVRWKAPEGSKSDKIELPVKEVVRPFAAAGSDFKFASAVASFGMLLRDSEFKGNTTYRIVETVARENKRVKGQVNPYRQEFVELVKAAEKLSRGRKAKD